VGIDQLAIKHIDPARDSSGDEGCAALAEKSDGQPMTAIDVDKP